MYAFISVPLLTESVMALVHALARRHVEIHTDVTSISVMARTGVRYHTPHPEIYTAPLDQYQWVICVLRDYPLIPQPSALIERSDSERCAILTRGLALPHIITVGEESDLQHVATALNSPGWTGVLNAQLAQNLADHASIAVQTWLQRTAAIRRARRAYTTAGAD